MNNLTTRLCTIFQLIWKKKLSIRILSQMRWIYFTIRREWVMIQCANNVTDDRRTPGTETFKWAIESDVWEGGESDSNIVQELSPTPTDGWFFYPRDRWCRINFIGIFIISSGSFTTLGMRHPRWNDGRAWKFRKSLRLSLGGFETPSARYVYLVHRKQWSAISQPRTRTKG